MRKKIFFSTSVILIFLFLLSEQVFTPSIMEKNHTRLEKEFALLKKNAPNIGPLIFLYINGSFYFLYDTPIKLTKKNYLKRVFNDNKIQVDKTKAINPWLINSNLSQNDFIEKYLIKNSDQEFFQINAQIEKKDPFIDVSTEEKEVALAAQYLYDYLVISKNGQIFLYNPVSYKLK